MGDMEGATLFTMTGSRVKPGRLAGKVVFVRNDEDLTNVDDRSLVILDGCGKRVATRALQKCAAAVNLVSCLTAHLNLALPASMPYAIVPGARSFSPGSLVEIDLKEEAFHDELEMVPFVPVKELNRTEELGGKGARLLQMETLGIHVPRFSAVSVSAVATLMAKAGSSLACSSDDSPTLKLIRKGLEEVISEVGLKALGLETLPGNGPWAVRSSAVDEDGLTDSKAGVFDTRLSVAKEELPEAMAEVIGSMATDEGTRDHAEGNRSSKGMAVVIQEMVSDPLLAGAFFTHMTDFDPLPIIEAKFLDYGDKQMDGSLSPDVRARCDSQGGNIVILQAPTGVSY